MADLKHATPSKILWIDLEMTGLDAQKDRIVEVAAIVTGWDFTPLDSLDYGVKQDEAMIRQLYAANPWAHTRPTETEELISHSLKGVPETQAETEILTLLDKHTAPGELILLAGNSIHCDRGFIKQWWPKLEGRLHYRMLDVSAWKVVMQGKYGVTYTKKEAHRALDDIHESIQELQSYLAAAKF
jgi:oligoribonuclease